MWQSSIKINSKSKKRKKKQIKKNISKKKQTFKPSPSKLKSKTNKNSLKFEQDVEHGISQYRYNLAYSLCATCIFIQHAFSVERQNKN